MCSSDLIWVIGGDTYADRNTEIWEALANSILAVECVEHVVICNRCKDFDINACNEHLASIAKLNDEVTSLNAQLKT